MFGRTPPEEVKKNVWSDKKRADGRGNSSARFFSFFGFSPDDQIPPPSVMSAGSTRLTGEAGIVLISVLLLSRILLSRKEFEETERQMKLAVEL
jgi:hypothetical protein